jgi:hypothetical protein
MTGSAAASRLPAFAIPAFIVHRGALYSESPYV